MDVDPPPPPKQPHSASGKKLMEHINFPCCAQVEPNSSPSDCCQNQSGLFPKQIPALDKMSEGEGLPFEFIVCKEDEEFQFQPYRRQQHTGTQQLHAALPKVDAPGTRDSTVENPSANPPVTVSEFFRSQPQVESALPPPPRLPDTVNNLLAFLKYLITKRQLLEYDEQQKREKGLENSPIPQPVQPPIEFTVQQQQQALAQPHAQQCYVKLGMEVGFNREQEIFMDDVPRPALSSEPVPLLPPGQRVFSAADCGIDLSTPKPQNANGQADSSCTVKRGRPATKPTPAGAPKPKYTPKVKSVNQPENKANPTSPVGGQRTTTESNGGLCPMFVNCPYCGARLPEDEYIAHLIANHSQNIVRQCGVCSTWMAGLSIITRNTSMDNEH